MKRRQFIKASVALSAAAVLPKPCPASSSARTNPSVRIVHSVCLGCNARCGIRVVTENDQIKEVTGNPYHPYNTMAAPLPSSTPLEESLKISAPVCGKAIEVDHYVHNPYRITKPLKRMGKRGEGKFEPIEWEQLIREITFGGRLFEHIGEDRHVPGLKELDSDEPIDPASPELGPKRNGLVFLTGRLQSGRKEFIDRFVKQAFGSINRIGHTDICGLGFRMGNYAFTEGRQVELKADPWGAKYILIFGANVYEALQPGVNTYGAALARRHGQGQVKLVIIDPRAQKASCHAHRWIPIKPGQDGAFAMGLIRWMIENKRYDRAFLKSPNLTAAMKRGNGAYVNATHLVVADDRHPLYGRFLRVGDLEEGANGKRSEDYVVLSKEKKFVSYESVQEAELEVDTVLVTGKGESIRVKSAFTIMKEGVMERSMEEYAALAGVEPGEIEAVAEEFSSHGPRAAVCQYHGAGNYVGGVYAAYAVAVLNAMVGNLQRKGGYLSSGGKAASWSKGCFDLKTFSGSRRPWGVRISREKACYHKSSEFRRKKEKGLNPYPAPRPWFPFTKGGLSVEALGGVDQGYPYPIGALFLYFSNPVYSTPGGDRFKDTLESLEKVPLLVSVDVGINESNIYADYIIPDVTYAEGHYGWLSPHAPALRFTAVRTPCIAPRTEKTPDGRPICLETLLIDLARALDLPGFGKKAVADRAGSILPLEKAEDFYLRGLANIARNAGLQGDDPEAVSFVEKNYPVAESKDILSPQQWKVTCQLLARGGIFKPYEAMFKGEVFVKGPKRFVLYNEELAGTRCSITGERFYGSLKYVPAPTPPKGFPLCLVSHKTSLHTQSRTVWHRSAMELHPENHVFMNRKDAEKLDLVEGDLVRVFSRDNPQGITGRLTQGETIREGVVAISISYGHTALGAGSLVVKEASSVFMGGLRVTRGHKLIGNPAMGAGINPNRLGALDRNLGRTPLVDLVAGIPDFSSTWIRVEKLNKPT